MIAKILAVLLTSFVACVAQADDISGPASPADNDKIIAAYMSSKDTTAIRHMLTVYAEADDTMLKDARRFAYLSSQFKNPANPRHDLQKTASTAAVMKYDCAARSQRCNQFMTIASGMWALDSLSRQDAQIKSTVGDFLNGNARMKKLYDDEGTIFSNYVTFVTISIAQPGKLENILTSYEQLGPLDMQAAQNALGMKK